MAWVYMDVAPTQEGGIQEKGFEKTISLSSASSSDSILIPDDVQNVTVTAQGAGGATATVQTTTDSVSIVKSGTGITWVTWGLGAITTAAGSVFAPITAIKLVQTGSGTSKITVRAQ